MLSAWVPEGRNFSQALFAQPEGPKAAKTYSKTRTEPEDSPS